MARKSSVVLTPAEKKEAVKTAKAALKEAQAALKIIAGEGKTRAKTRAAEDKDFDKRVLAAEKVLAAAQAQVDALTAEA